MCFVLSPCGCEDTRGFWVVLLKDKLFASSSLRPLRVSVGCHGIQQSIATPQHQQHTKKKSKHYAQAVIGRAASYLFLLSHLSAEQDTPQVKSHCPLLRTWPKNTKTAFEIYRINSFVLNATGRGKKSQYYSAMFKERKLTVGLCGCLPCWEMVMQENTVRSYIKASLLGEERRFVHTLSRLSVKSKTGRWERVSQTCDKKTKQKLNTLKSSDICWSDGN